MDFLILLAIGLQVADVVTTLRVLDKGGRELNPLLAKLFAKYGPVPVLLTTKIILVLILLLANDWRLNAIVSVMYVGVVGFNIRQMRK